MICIHKNILCLVASCCSVLLLGPGLCVYSLAWSQDPRLYMCRPVSLSWRSPGRWSCGLLCPFLVSLLSPVVLCLCAGRCLCVYSLAGFHLFRTRACICSQVLRTLLRSQKYNKVPILFHFSAGLSVLFMLLSMYSMARLWSWSLPRIPATSRANVLTSCSPST